MTAKCVARQIVEREREIGEWMTLQYEVRADVETWQEQKRV